LKQFLAIAAVLALLLQGTAWADMAPAAGLETPSGHVSSSHHVHCSKAGPHAADGHVHTFEHAATEHCEPECGCSSFCAGVLGASLTPQVHPTDPEAAHTACPIAHVARQPGTPFRPPIVVLG
jgi:hypothetical protein